MWARVPEDRRTAVHAMRVFGDDGRSEIRFDAYRAGVPELAWTVEDRVLHVALAAQARARETVGFFAPAQCESLVLDEARVRLRLGGGRELEAPLVVGADGARSFVRSAAGIDAKSADYGQVALVADFACDRSHEHTAYQWFQSGAQGRGVLALLPLPGDQVSMVWSLERETAERLATFEARALAREVAAASGEALGGLRLMSDVRSYPLRRLAARRLVQSRLALVGDAGHVIHPLAGQGLNLGLQDVRALADVLNRREPGRDPGDERLLRRYERQRAEPILAMDLMVDSLFRLFGAQGAAVSRLRNSGLNLTNKVPVLKNLLMRQAMR